MNLLVSLSTLILNKSNSLGLFWVDFLMPFSISNYQIISFNLKSFNNNIKLSKYKLFDINIQGTINHGDQLQNKDEFNKNKSNISLIYLIKV